MANHSGKNTTRAHRDPTWSGHSGSSRFESVAGPLKSPPRQSADLRTRNQGATADVLEEQFAEFK